MPNSANVDLHELSERNFCRPMLASIADVAEMWGVSADVHCEEYDLTETLIGGCDPKLREADERCPECVGS